MAVQLAPNTLGIQQNFHLQPMRPYRLFCSESSGNSSYEPPGHKRIRLHSPQNDFPWTGAYGAQRGRVWLHKTNVWPYDTESTVGPYENYRVYLKTGVFHRAGRDHLDSPYHDRFEMGMYGWGRCRAKEMNGQIIMSDPVLRPHPNPKVHYSHMNTAFTDAGSDCRMAAYGTHPTDPPISQVCEDPFGFLITLPVGHDGFGYQWNAFVKVRCNIPAGSIILAAVATIYSGAAGSAVCRMRLVDHDDCPDFDATPGTSHALINPWPDTDADLIDPLVTGDPPSPVYLNLDMKPLVEAFIGRAGYAPGNHLGLAFINEASNALGEVAYIHRVDEVPIIRIAVRYAEPDYVPGSPPPKPPTLYSYEKFHLENPNQMIPSEEMGELEPSVISGDSDRANRDNWIRIYEDLVGSDYKYIWFMPVPALASWWDEVTHGEAPYPDDAHVAPYPFNECGTYPIPCSLRRSTPYRYGRIGAPLDWVKGGLRGCVGHADKPPLPGVEPMYYQGCVGYENASSGLTESLIHPYEARTQTARHVYSTVNGWWVEYTIYVKAWLVYGDHRNFLHIPINYPPGADPDNYGTLIHWNCFYEMQVVANWKAPPVDHAEYASFIGWVAAKENGFGGRVVPRHRDNCNDVLLNCAGLRCAMGDIERPPAGVQEDDCRRVVTEGGGDPCASGDSTPGCRLPCVEDGRTSWWYLPEWGSNHPMTPLVGPVIPQMPQYGLFHEFERTVFTAPPVNGEGPQRTDHGWMQVGFQANHPIISGGTPIDPFPRNHVVDVQPFKPLTAQLVPDSAYGYVEYTFTDTLNLLGAGYGQMYTFGIYHGDSAATVEATINAVMLGHDVCIVTKTGTDPDVFQIEWNGVFSYRRIALEVTFYEAFPAGDFESEITDVVTPSNGGIEG